MRRLAVVLAALPLLAAACGGSGSSSSSGTKQGTGAKLTPAASVKKAAAKTAEAKSERVSLTGVTSTAGQQVTMTGDGAFDNTRHSGNLTMHANVAGVDMQIDAVMDATTLYMRSPVLSAALPTGKTWMKIDLQKVGKSNGLDFSALLTQDPAQQLKQLQAVGPMTVVGEETVGGVAATHYRGRIDISKAPQGAKIERLTKAKYGPYDVWVGKDDGYIHRMKTSYSYAVPGGSRQAIAMTMNYSDFGTDVSVNVPSGAETFDATNTSISGLGG